MTRRSGLLTLAVLLVVASTAAFAQIVDLVVLVGGRWLALETAERAWAATFTGGAVLLEARALSRLMQIFVVLFAVTWATGNIFVVYRVIGSVQLPRRLGDLEIVEAVPQRVLFALTLGTGIVGGLLLTLGTGDWWQRALFASARRTSGSATSCCTTTSATTLPSCRGSPPSRPMPWRQR